VKYNRFLILFLTPGVAFGFFMGMAQQSFSEGVLAGVLFALMFGTMMSFFQQLQKRKFRKIKVELAKNHELIYDGGANLFRGKEAVGGWLYLTANCLIFKSHKINLHTGETTILLTDIEELDVKDTLGFVKNGLVVKTKEKTFNFIVDKRENWIVVIKNQKENL